MSNRSLAALLRVSAAVLTLAAVIVFFLKFSDARAVRGGLSELSLSALIAIGLALLLAGIADLLAHRDDGFGDIPRMLGRMQQHLHDMEKKQNDMAVAMAPRGRNRAPANPPPTQFPAHITATLPPHAFDPIL